ncbi:AAA family ATPase [Agrococcus sp. SGAir0287]|uniref:AAA family ATPase n=1 Tax=Agrococcus sp. SGAir0287 TaxID=2070347 RepID=UPI0010CD5CEE|nr:AAA family ATPase [Agrococcus sp. SGAir0287]QCR19735.1 hypothetical protein C1N71_10120 [Agrococcus sp. SGAir0287]
MLVVLAGLPGTGKTTIAAALAAEVGATLASVDDAEAAMLAAGIDAAQPTGLAAYVVVEQLARRQLVAGRDVVVDAVNDAPEARDQWRALAATTGVELRWVEVRLADEAEHRRRLAERTRDLPGGFPEPSWASVVARRAALEAWDEPRIVVDARQDAVASVAAIRDALRHAD